MGEADPEVLTTSTPRRPSRRDRSSSASSLPPTWASITKMAASRLVARNS